jgi:hypothetical protein
LAAEPTIDATDGTLIDASLQRWRDLGPWVAVVTGPLAALSQLTLGFVLTPAARDLGSKTILHAISVLMLAATVAATLACGRHFRRARTTAEDPRSERASRARFVGLGGLLLNLFSLLLVLAQALPIFMLGLED